MWCRSGGCLSEEFVETVLPGVDKQGSECERFGLGANTHRVSSFIASTFAVSRYGG
jgi:hypothetical protein